MDQSARTELAQAHLYWQHDKLFLAVWDRDASAHQRRDATARRGIKGFDHGHYCICHSLDEATQGSIQPVLKFLQGRELNPSSSPSPI